MTDLAAMRRMSTRLRRGSATPIRRSTADLLDEAAAELKAIRPWRTLVIRLAQDPKPSIAQALLRATPAQLDQICREVLESAERETQ